MKESDFYTLNVGQKIWYKNKNYSVESLSRGEINMITLGKEDGAMFSKEPHQWRCIYQDCSLTQPEQKQKVRIRKNEKN